MAPRQECSGQCMEVAGVSCDRVWQPRDAVASVDRAVHVANAAVADSCSVL